MKKGKSLSRKNSMVGRLIREARIKLKKKQSEVGALSHTMISHIENGHAPMPLDQIHMIAKELKMNPFELVDVLVEEFREKLLERIK